MGSERQRWDVVNHGCSRDFDTPDRLDSVHRRIADQFHFDSGRVGLGDIDSGRLRRGKNLQKPAQWSLGFFVFLVFPESG